MKETSTMKNELHQDVIHEITTKGYSDAFSIMGMHQGYDEKLFIRAFHPDADTIEVIDLKTKKSVGVMKKNHDSGLFQINLEKKQFFPYSFKINLKNGKSYETRDAYSFLPVISEEDLYLYNEGNHYRIYEKLGAHVIEHDGAKGVCFAVWAPSAKRVSVVGSFNNWDGRRHTMRLRGSSGIWEIFIPDVKAGDMYKYEIVGCYGQVLPLKSDPFAFYAEKKPATSSIVYDPKKYKWKNKNWVEQRKKLNDLNAPTSIYEVHLGSWRRNPEEGMRYLTYKEMAKELVPYVKEMGFTHVEFMPISEHPFDGSWGYQTLGLYAPTSRFGTPDDFKALIDAFHSAGIAVIIDWVPGHFPKDAYGLSFFDGTHLYDHADPRKGEHKTWGTRIYNFGRNEVRNFLLANALFWMREYQIDGIRVDAVASMIYLDYDREDGQWVANQYGGNENLEATYLLRRMNELVYSEDVGFATYAEESTSFPMVSRPTYLGGLGFSYKWNMGWMHDTLKYMSKDPVYREHHQHNMTFGLIYAFSENFVLPLSHDEVVHGKKSLIEKMPGDTWQKFANLRSYYTFMYTHPGKKLLFMGGEFAHDYEWYEEDSLRWFLLGDDYHKGIQTIVKDLNDLYSNHNSLHELDFEQGGFEWIDYQDARQSVMTYIRKGKNPDDYLVIACNFTPVPRDAYPIGVNEGVEFKQIFNSDSKKYGGSGYRENQKVTSYLENYNNRDYMMRVDLPPLSTIILKPERKKK